ncbi:MAG TPA: branched-chain amino acid ABC transporter permease [Candidatus Methylacidiphilales bacterium]
MLSYLLAISTFTAIYALLALGLNLMWGMTGMVNLGILGYYALGGYVSALVTVDLGYPLVVGVIIGTVAAAVFGAATCVGIVKLRDDYLAIVTLGFAEMMRVVAENEVGLTNGTDGIGQIPRPSLFGSGMVFNISYLAMCLLAVAIVVTGMELIRTAPLGRALRAIREDTMVAGTAGKNVLRFQILALTLGGGVMGLAGALYVHYVTYISPDIFQPQLLIYVFFALILGGRGNNWGALVGTVLVMVLVEGTRFLAQEIPGLSAVQVGALRALIIGIGLVAVMQWKPQGILPEPMRIYREPLSSAKDGAQASEQ